MANAIAPIPSLQNPASTGKPTVSQLPAIDGSGLTQAEFFRVNGYGNRARVAYAESIPDIDAVELARVERVARQDGLRAVLRERPIALATVPPMGESCCGASEVIPCSACVKPDAVEGQHEAGSVTGFTSAFQQALEADLARVGERTREFRQIPGFRVTDDCCESYFEAGPDLTLERVIEATLNRLINFPDLFNSERVVWDTCGNILAIIARRDDGLPQAIRLDSPPEYITVSFRDTPEVIERQPVSDRNWFWSEEPAEEPQRRLTLPELIDLEVRRLRDRGNEAGDLMAGALQELSRVVRIVSAERPDQVAERLSILEGYTEHSLAWEMPEPEMTPAGRLA